MPFELFADDALTGGGIVGGIVAVATALYLLYDKFKTRQETSAATKLALKTAEVNIEGLANQKVAEAYDKFAAERKAAHERDVAFLRQQIEEAKTRLESLEGRERECQKTCDALQSQNTAQAREITELRVKIEGLESKLRRALPGSGDHTPV
jgi:hypothetical protein